MLQDHLTQWAVHHIKEQHLNLSHMPCPPQVAFHTTPYNKSSPGGSYDTWITTCTLVLSTAAIDDPYNHLHNPPTGLSPVSQAWSSPVPVPTVIEMTAQSSSPSSQTNKELDGMCAENTQLCRDMQELRDQLCQLCSARAPPPAPPNIDYQMLVSAFISAMQQQPLQAQFATQQLPASASAASDPANSLCGASSKLDTSMAQGPSESILDTTTSSAKSFDNDDHQ
ncbi:hypothetical protein ACA910_006988 [Epithemia clementina (nom. ined.)]